MIAVRSKNKALSSSALSAKMALFCLGVSVAVAAGCSATTESGSSFGPVQETATETEIAQGETFGSSTTTQIDVDISGGDANSNELPGVEPPEVIVVSALKPGEVVARRAPSDDGEVIAGFENPTEVGAPLVFQAAAEEPLSADGQWIEVLLPIRPNGSTGWIPSSQVELTANPYRIEIRPDQFELSLFRSNELVFTTDVGIGTGDTPTPRGRFYIIELLEAPNPSGPYGPYAFGLSGFSETLKTFAGGNGVIGIHGTNDPSALGTNVSHGCIRIENSVVTEMSTYLPLGTPVVIAS